jgi:D-alanyl-D-alanine carboxypeptidase
MLKCTIQTLFLILCLFFVNYKTNLTLFSSAFAYNLELENNCSANNSYLIFDAKSQQVLLQKNANTIIYPASLTKVMTAYLVFDAIKNKKLRWNQKITISHKAHKISLVNKVNTLNLQPQQTISVLEATQAMLVRSYNETAVALAEAVAKDEQKFADEMNKKAQELGMTNTFFVNSSGLHDNKQYSTAHDLAKLAFAVKRDFSEFYHLFSLKEFQIKNTKTVIKNINKKKKRKEKIVEHRKYYSHNEFLLNYEGAEGMKTGYTKASGFNLIAVANQNNQQLFGILIGCESSKKRTKLMKMLFDIGFYIASND